MNELVMGAEGSPKNLSPASANGNGFIRPETWCRVSSTPYSFMSEASFPKEEEVAGKTVWFAPHGWRDDQRI
jgi:hypothetical protein